MIDYSTFINRFYIFGSQDRSGKEHPLSNHVSTKNKFLGDNKTHVCFDK